MIKNKKPTEVKRLLVSFSGGRTSAYMLWYIWNHMRHEYSDIKVVFANTGKEKEETLLFVHKCEEIWDIPIVWIEAKHLDENGNKFSKKGWAVKHKLTNYIHASRSGEPFEEMISVLGIPSTNAPLCSYQLKRFPIKHYMKSIGWRGYYTAIGIRNDEIDRMSPSFRKDKIIYPLIDDSPMTKEDVLSWWSAREFDLTVDPDFGNCDNCWKKDLTRLVRNARKSPHSFEWWQRMTDKYGSLNPRKTHLSPPFNFYRGNLSPADIISLTPYPDSEISKKAKERKLNSCSESCEAF